MGDLPFPEQKQGSSGFRGGEQREGVAGARSMGGEEKREAAAGM